MYQKQNYEVHNLYLKKRERHYLNPPVMLKWIKKRLQQNTYSLKNAQMKSMHKFMCKILAGGKLKGKRKRE